MPRYHFHIDDGSTPDPEGDELQSLTVAKCEAIKLAGRSICDAAGEFWHRAEWNMTVTDDEGLTLFTLHVMGIEAPVARQRDASRTTA